MCSKINYLEGLSYVIQHHLKTVQMGMDVSQHNSQLTLQELTLLQEA